jgi:ferric-dicitrate binding protein FerR (iron transport regulator)
MRHELLALCVGASMSVSISVAFAIEQRAGSVTELIGAATASAEGRTRNLTVKEVILAGDEIRTGSGARLSLLLGESTELRLGGKTELRISSYAEGAGGEIDFTKGTIKFERSGAAPVGELRFNTPYGQIAPQGTVFYAGPSRGAFGVFVRQGKVAVSAAGRTVIAGPGQGTSIAKPGDAPTKPVVWRPERIREIEAQVR